MCIYLYVVCDYVCEHVRMCMFVSVCVHVCDVYVCVETGHLEVARCEWAESSGDWQGSAPLMRARGGGVQSPCGAVPGGCEEPESAATVFWGNLELW